MICGLSPPFPPYGFLLHHGSLPCSLSVIIYVAPVAMTIFFVYFTSFRASHHVLPKKFGFPFRSDFFDSWCHLLCVAPDVGSLPFFTPAFISAVCCRSLHVVILAGVVTLVSPSPLHLLTHGSTPDSTPGDLQPHKYPGHPPYLLPTDVA